MTIEEALGDRPPLEQKPQYMTIDEALADQQPWNRTLSPAAPSPYDVVPPSLRPVPQKELAVQGMKNAALGMVAPLGGMAGARFLGPMMWGPVAEAIGEGASIYGTSRAMGDNPKETGVNVLVGGGLGLAVGGLSDITARLTGTTTSLPDGVVSETLHMPFNKARRIAYGNAPENANLNAGREVIDTINSEQARLPQMRQDYSQTPYSLEKQRLGLVGKQNEVASRIGNQSDLQMTALSDKLRQATAGLSLGRQSKSADLRTQTKVNITNNRLARDSAIGNAGRNIDSALSEAEHSLAGNLKDLLQSGDAGGVKIDVGPLLDKAQALIPVKPTTIPRQATKSALENWIDSVRQNYSTDIGPLIGKVEVSPTEAYRILQDLRAVSPGTYGNIKEAATGRTFHDLQRNFKQDIYDAVTGTGEEASKIHQTLNAREGLRTYLSEDNPSGFVKQIVAKGPGARDRLMALREFERTHGTSGQIEKSLNDIADRYGSELTRFGAEQRSGSERINAEYQASIEKLRAGDTAGRAKIDALRQKRLDALKKGYSKKLEDVGIQQDLAAGRRESAFNRQPSTLQEQQKFGAQENLRKYVSEKNPQDFVRNFLPGKSQDQSTVDAVRQFEQQSGVQPGTIESRLRELAMKDVWTQAEKGQATSLARIWEKFAGKPVAKFFAVWTKPIGRAAAGFGAYGARQMQEKKKESSEPSPEQTFPGMTNIGQP